MFDDQIINPISIVHYVELDEVKKEKDPILGVLRSNATDRISESSMDIIAAATWQIFGGSNIIPSDIFESKNFPIMDTELVGRHDNVKKRVVIFTKDEQTEYAELYGDSVVGVVVYFSVNESDPWNFIIPIYIKDEIITISNKYSHYVGEAFIKKKLLPKAISDEIYDYLRRWYTMQVALRDPVKKSWLNKHYKELGLSAYNPETERAIVDGEEKYVYAKDDMPKPKRNKKQDGETRNYVRKTNAWPRMGHFRTNPDGTESWVKGTVCGPDRELVKNHEIKIKTRERHVILNPEIFDVDQKAIIESNKKRRNDNV